MLRRSFLILFLLFGIYLSAQEDPAAAEYTPGADLPEADLPENGFARTDLPETDYLETDLPETDLPGADLPGTGFAGTGFPESEEQETGTEETTEVAEEKPPKPKRDKRIKNRGFELSLANISNVGFANDFIGLSDIFLSPFAIIHNYRDIILHPFKTDYEKLTFNPYDIFHNPIEIDIDKFLEGFRFDFGATIKPLSINFNRKDRWGFGFDIGHTDIYVNLSLPDTVIGLKPAIDEKFGAGVSAFTDVAIPVFFHTGDLKVKIRPAVYLPLVYSEPDLHYTLTDTSIELKYNMRVYSPLGFQTDDKGNVNNINFEGEATIWEILPDNLGYDFNLGFEYPLYSWLDIGVDFFNIPVPFLGAKLNHYISLKDTIWANTDSIDIVDLIVNDGKIDESQVYHLPEYSMGVGYDSSGQNILRPFKMIAYGNYRPFETKYFTLIPALGFSVNSLYSKVGKVGAFEGGLGIRFDHNNCSILTLGWHYMDRKWKNSIDCTLNLRLIQFDLGIVFQSQDFVQSWRGAGFALNFGIKLGW